MIFKPFLLIVGEASLLMPTVEVWLATYQKLELSHEDNLKLQPGEIQVKTEFWPIYELERGQS